MTAASFDPNAVVYDSVESHHGAQMELSRDTLERKAALEALGQTPGGLSIECVDSRVNDSGLRGVKDGDCLAHSVPGPFVPPYHPDGFEGIGASIELAMSKGVGAIFITNHNDCGMANALANLGRHDSYMARWCARAERARDAVLAAGLDPVEHQSVLERTLNLLNIQNLMTYPDVRENVMTGRLALVPLYAQISNASLLEFNPFTGRYESLRDAESQLMSGRGPALSVRMAQQAGAATDFCTAYSPESFAHGIARQIADSQPGTNRRQPCPGRHRVSYGCG